MINHPAFREEPWCLRATDLDVAVLAQTESLFALANGHIGWPGSLDEGEPHGLPGSYLNDVYELRPLPYAEPGHGYPAAGQTVVNVTNGKLISLRGRPIGLAHHAPLLGALIEHPAPIRITDPPEDSAPRPSLGVASCLIPQGRGDALRGSPLRRSPRVRS